MSEPSQYPIGLAPEALAEQERENRRLSDRMIADEAQRDLRINSERAREIVTIEGRAARKRAEAWARSPIGTPYGAKEPTR